MKRALLTISEKTTKRNKINYVYLIFLASM